MFGLNKYTAKPPVLSDKAVGMCWGGGLRRKSETEKGGKSGGMRWNERANEGGG